jgi:hypothetical protein
MIDRHQVIVGDRQLNFVRAAARNNAEWCDIIYGLHSITSRFHADMWTAERRSPPVG